MSKKKDTPVAPVAAAMAEVVKAVAPQGYSSDAAFSENTVDSEAMAAQLREAQANGTSGDIELAKDKEAMKREAAERHANGLVLVIATGPGGISPDELHALTKDLGAMGHVVAEQYSEEADDGVVWIHDAISNIAHIMNPDHVVGVLLRPDWSVDPASRAEVFAAVNMDRKLYALDVAGGSLIEISHWAVLATLAAHPMMIEAAAIYAPLPGKAG